MPLAVVAIGYYTESGTSAKFYSVKYLLLSVSPLERFAFISAVASPAFIFRGGTWGDRDKSRGATIKCMYVLGPFTTTPQRALSHVLQ